MLLVKQSLHLRDLAWGLQLGRQAPGPLSLPDRHVLGLIQIVGPETRIVVIRDASENGFDLPFLWFRIRSWLLRMRHLASCLIKIKTSEELLTGSLISLRFLLAVELEAECFSSSWMCCQLIPPRNGYT
jgi:hypothetical protein